MSSRRRMVGEEKVLLWLVGAVATAAMLAVAIISNLVK